jgi:hypothetical protein
MTKADSVHSTPRRFMPKIVGGIDHRPKKSETEPRTQTGRSYDAARCPCIVSNAGADRSESETGNGWRLTQGG